MEWIAELVRDLLIFVAVMFALFIVLIVVISRMPPDNPLRQVLVALARRVAATWGLALIDIPASTLQPIGDLWDIGTLLFLAYYWYTFFRDDTGRAMRTLKDAMRSGVKSK
jgi:hypothetical protein